MKPSIQQRNWARANNISAIATIFLSAFLFLQTQKDSLGFAFQAEEATLSDPELRISADLQILASDAMLGRGVDGNGIEVAAEYIAERWKTLGLKTDLFNGSPFQEFSLSGTLGLDESQSNELSLVVSDGSKLELELGKDFVPLAIGSNGSFHAPVVFAGYGITARGPDFSYDDYSGIDVKGKVVIVLRKNPRQGSTDAKLIASMPKNHAYFNTKEANAALHGAVGMIIVNDSVTVQSQIDQGGREEMLNIESAGRSFRKNGMPIFFVSHESINAWFEKSAGRSISSIEAAIDAELKPQSFAILGWKAIGASHLKETRTEVKNVLAILPGEGELQNETVVVGAHYDHVGMGGDGSLASGVYEVHNGADDNGSGTVGLLELSRTLKETLQGKSHRQILFIAFSAEERGLLGSQFYVNHPKVPLEETVTMVNLDMIGRLREKRLVIYGNGTSTSFTPIINDLNASYNLDLELLPEGMGPSDHQSFFEKKIPVLHFFTGLHPDYHRPSDDFAKINVTGIVTITDMVRDVVSKIATEGVRPDYQSVAGYGNPSSVTIEKPRIRPRLNVKLDSSATQAIVFEVEVGGAAEKSGMLARDILVAIDDEEITHPGTVAPTLEKLGKTPGDMVSVAVNRDGEIVRLQLQLGR